MTAYGPVYGLNDEMCMKIASAFGAGMGYMQETCGAVTGAFMVIGLKHHTGSGDRSSRETVYRLVKEFVRAFESRTRSIKCRELLDFDISTREGLEDARKSNIFKVCVDYVREAAGILERIL